MSDQYIIIKVPIREVINFGVAEFDKDEYEKKHDVKLKEFVYSQAEGKSLVLIYKGKYEASKTKSTKIKTGKNTSKNSY